MTTLRIIISGVDGNPSQSHADPLFSPGIIHELSKVKQRGITREKQALGPYAQKGFSIEVAHFVFVAVTDGQCFHKSHRFLEVIIRIVRGKQDMVHTKDAFSLDMAL